MEMTGLVIPNWIARARDRLGDLWRLKPAVSAWRRPAAPYLLSEQRFNEELLRVRACSDRRGCSIGVVILELIDGANRRRNPEMMVLLGRIVSKRIRRSDTVGWYGNRIGVILCGTTREEVTGVVENIEGLFRGQACRLTRLNQSIPEISCDVIMYPDGLPKQGQADGLSVKLHQTKA